jgi:hypothetical protein
MGRARGFKARHDQAWQYLLGLEPDLVFAQETVPPSWLPHAGLVSAPAKGWRSVILSSHYPIEPYTLPEGHPLRNRYLSIARVSLPNRSSIFAASVHAAPRKASEGDLQGLDRAKLTRSGATGPKLNDVIFDRLVNLVGDRFIVAGDWNTARKQGSAWASKVGQVFFDRVRDRGWYNCTGDRSESDVLTWLKGRGGDGLIQDDYVFCDQALGGLVQPEPWAPADEIERLGLSDHAPLIVDFAVESKALENL